MLTPQLEQLAQAADVLNQMFPGMGFTLCVSELGNADETDVRFIANLDPASAVTVMTKAASALANKTPIHIQREVGHA
jgi:hypothetical protein